MTRFHFERPDGLQSDAQNILVHLNEIIPPQGLESGGVTPPPTVTNGWIDNFNNQFVDNLGNNMVFAP